MQKLLMLQLVMNQRNLANTFTQELNSVLCLFIIDAFIAAKEQVLETALKYADTNEQRMTLLKE